MGRLKRSGYGSGFGATPTYEAEYSALYEPFTGKGVGKRMYELVIGALRKKSPNGFYMVNNECGTLSTTVEAKRVWDSLAKVYPSETRQMRVALYIGKKK